MAKKEKQLTPDQLRKSQAMRKVTLMIMAIVTAIIMAPFAAVVAIGMLPTMVAWFADERKEKDAALTVALLNFCGVAPNLITLWNKGGDMHHALQMMYDPFNLLMMYGAAGLGWMLISVMPPVMSFLISVRTEETMRKLDQRLKKLREEWGESLKDASIEITPEMAENYEI